MDSIGWEHIEEGDHSLLLLLEHTWEDPRVMPGGIQEESAGWEAGGRCAITCQFGRLEFWQAWAGPVVPFCLGRSTLPTDCYLLLPAD